MNHSRSRFGEGLVILGVLLPILVGCGRKTSTSSTSEPQPTTADSPAAAELKIGDVAPTFSGKAHDGSLIDLAQLKGKPVVLYFYPRDETPGCTAQACALRDAWTELEKTGAVLVGVSTDSDESHRKFAEHHKLPFHLLSDPDGALAKRFGVPVNLGFASRQSFVIGPDGNLRGVFRKVDVKTHAQDVLELLRPS